jgi:cytochrome b subunit of formate dehydrogenase
MVPTRRDFTDAVQMIRYYLRLAPSAPRFDHFDYRQKFEYWGLVIGAVVVISTGLILYFPILFTRLFPGELVPAAKVAHSNEGLMAFLVVILWHIYNAHLNPDVFPFDKTIFTGKISLDRMKHEHPLELERLKQYKDIEESSGASSATRRRRMRAAGSRTRHARRTPSMKAAATQPCRMAWPACASKGLTSP